jgi:hypothetical protein
MTTWSDISAVIERALPVAVVAENWLGLRRRSGLRVRVVAVSALGEPHVVVVAQVCDFDLLSPTAALAINERLPVGALVLEKGGYLLRHVLPIGSLEGATLLRTIEFIADKAQALRDAIHARIAGGGEALAAYAD